MRATMSNASGSAVEFIKARGIPRGGLRRLTAIDSAALAQLGTK
jgi:hypothetical protein